MRAAITYGIPATCTAVNMLTRAFGPVGFLLAGTYCGTEIGAAGSEFSPGCRPQRTIGLRQAEGRGEVVQGI